MNTIRILLIERNSALRNFLRNLLINQSPHFMLVGEAGSEEVGVGLLARSHPELILLDLDLFAGDLPELIQQAHKLEPPAKILVLTSQRDRSFLLFLLDEGIDGLVSKDQSMALLEEAIPRVAQGERGGFLPEFLSPRSSS